MWRSLKLLKTVQAGRSEVEDQGSKAAPHDGHADEGGGMAVEY